MTTMDIAAIAAAPTSPDVPPASPGAVDEASGFAALLDEAAHADAAGDPARGTGEDDANEDEILDELAALAMTSLLSLPEPVTTEELSDVDATAGIDDVGNAAGAEASCGPDEESGTTQAAVADDGNETALPQEWRAKVRTATSQPAADARTQPDAGETDAAPAIEDEPETETAASTRTEAAPPSAAKPRAASASRADKGSHAAAAITNADPVAAAQVNPDASAAAAAAKIDTQAPPAAAVRLARALERAAAALTDGAEGNAQQPQGEVSIPGAAQTFAGGNGGSDQPSFSGGDGSAEKNPHAFTAPRQANGAVSFTIAAPESFDMRTVVRQVETIGQSFEPSAAASPGRDVVEQLVQSMRVQFRDGIGEAVVRLRPEHLGAVQISLKIEHGAITATVHAEVASVRQLLEAQQDTLRSSLAEQGLRLERFAVEPDGQRQASRDDGQPREERRRQQRRRMSGTDHPVFEVTA